jgi:hypothetical protein
LSLGFPAQGPQKVWPSGVRGPGAFEAWGGFPVVSKSYFAIIIERSLSRQREWSAAGEGNLSRRGQF